MSLGDVSSHFRVPVQAHLLCFRGSLLLRQHGPQQRAMQMLGPCYPGEGPTLLASDWPALAVVLAGGGSEPVDGRAPSSLFQIGEDQ